MFVEIPAGVLLDREFRKAASLRAVFGLPYLPEEVPAQKIESRTDTYLCAVDRCVCVCVCSLAFRVSLLLPLSALRARNVFPISCT